MPALLINASAVSARAGQSQSVERQARIDSSILAALEADGVAQFIVEFTETADLSFADPIEDWDERGWFGYRPRRKIADMS